MGKTVDLEGARKGIAMLRGAIRNNPNVLARLTDEGIEAMYNDDETVIVSVRLSKALAEKLAAYARKEAYRRDERVTRNSVINEFLEAAMHEQRSQHQEKQERQP